MKQTTNRASLRFAGTSLQSEDSAWLGIAPGTHALADVPGFGPNLVLGSESIALGEWLSGGARTAPLVDWQVTAESARTLIVSARPDDSGWRVDIADAPPSAHDEAAAAEPERRLLAQAALGLLTTDLSHELNNRINGIHVNAELLRMLGERSGETKVIAAADRILSECRQSNALFDTLVTVGRVLFGHRAPREALISPDLLSTFTRVAGGEPIVMEAPDDARISAQLTLCLADVCRVVRTAASGDTSTGTALRCELLSTDAAVLTASDKANAAEAGHGAGGKPDDARLAAEIVRSSGGWLGWRRGANGTRVVALLNSSAGLPDILGAGLTGGDA